MGVRQLQGRGLFGQVLGSVEAREVIIELGEIVPSLEVVGALAAFIVSDVLDCFSI